MKISLPKPHVSLRSLILFLLVVQVFLNSFTLFRQEHYPLLVLYNPNTNLAELIRANRDEKALLELFRGGFYHATAMATGSHPYEPPSPGDLKLADRILDQFFSPQTAGHIQRFRTTMAQHHAYGTVDLVFNSFDRKRLRIEPKGGAFFFESFFNQTTSAEGTRRIRTFYVRALGNLAPATLDNPYNIKFTAFEVREVEPKKRKE